MNRKMLIVFITMLVIVSVPAFAAAKTGSSSQPSTSIWLPGRSGLHSWRAIKHDELIVWASPSRPYLVKIWRPFRSLRFVNFVGVTSFAGRVTKFDQVIVDGQRLPIKSITALDRESAKQLRWTKT